MESRDRHLHIVSFDVPWPANYGGVIDVFYKVKALSDLGIKIQLHCFMYGRQKAAELDEVCEEVHYYERNMNKTLVTHPLPFIVVRRQQNMLLRTLLKDDHPILFEGKHSSYYLDHPELKDRLRFVRTHNVETDYYQALAEKERGFVKRQYLKLESKKLGRFTENLRKASGLFCISPKDLDHFSKFNSVDLVPPFHSDETAFYSTEKEDFALYHGNLAVAENEESARYLIEHVFSDSEKELRIFGSGASKQLRRTIGKHKNISLVHADDLRSMVRVAQINILPTFQATGMKLKLLFSLFNGGHVIVNQPMVEKTGLSEVCVVRDSVPDMREAVNSLWNKQYEAVDFEKRKAVLEEGFGNKQHAQTIVNRIFA